MNDSERGEKQMGKQGSCIGVMCVGVLMFINKTLAEWFGLMRSIQS